MMMPNKNSFRLISRRRFKGAGENVAPASSPVEDERRRLFLKALGAVGLGLLGVSVLPKKGQALVMGGAPATSVVGLKDSNNSRINPATEDGNLATIAGKDFATETTLSGVKTATDKFRFDASNNLKVITSNSSSVDVVGLKDAQDTRVNPVDYESILYLRRMVKLMESQATVDSANRQRVAVEAMPTTAVTISSGTVTTVSTVTNMGTLAGQNQQMYQDVARNAYANGIRNNLSFS